MQLPIWLRARPGACGIVLAALAALAPAPARAQPPAKRIHAVQVERAPVIDGHLDDPAWRAAPFVSDFEQKQPAWGQTPSRRTEVAIVYDREALYLGARMHADGPSDIQAVMTRRDETGTAERIIVSFDTFRDRRTAVTFAVTAAGVRADWYHPDDVEFYRDFSFNPVWDAKTAIGPAGWTAELRIPFTQMRFADGATHDWGININRYIPQRNEDIYWIPVPRTENAWASYFGALGGLGGIRQPLRLEIVPYLAGDVTTRSSALVAPDDPFTEDISLGGNAGADAKLGLGPSLTLDMTVNPDFGQVEADPAEVNLSAYETFFEERRPFFTEGSQLLDGRGLLFYYSRRIGAAPRGSVDLDEDRDGDGVSDLDVSYLDQPRTARILGAAKLTGRLPSGLSVGTLAAVTAPARADYLARYTDGSERTGTALVEPTTSYGVVRVQQEMDARGSLVGATLTGVARALGDDPLAQELARQAVTGGADWSLRLAEGAYGLDGFLGFSHLRGEPGAMATIARSSVHYLQRPDQDHVSLDADARALSGLAGGADLYRRQGAWQGGLHTSFETPAFEANDLGRLRNADDVFAGADLIYRQTEPGALVHQWESGLIGDGLWNFGGVLERWSLQSFGGITWKNFWRTEGQITLLTPGYSDADTRGGPLTGTGWGTTGYAGVLSPFGGRNQWNAFFDYAWLETGERRISVTGGVTLQPTDRVRVSLSPRYRRLRDVRQYVDTIDDAALAGNPETYGKRYVFATVARRELAVQARVQVIFTPDVSLELYAEPFASSGRFYRFGELPAPKSRGLAVYGRDLGAITRRDGGYDVTVGSDAFAIDDPDFTALSFRSTAVMRWEFLPGSTMFLVWQNSREDGLDAPARVTPLSLGDALRSPGSQTVAVKLAYWWPAD